MALRENISHVICSSDGLTDIGFINPEIFFTKFSVWFNIMKTDFVLESKYKNKWQNTNSHLSLSKKVKKS